MLDLINVSYDTQIPNNVGLSSDKKVLKALENWHPGYINWWNDLIPQNFQESHGLPAHRRVGRSQGLGQVRLCQDAGIPLGRPAGAAGRGPQDPAAASMRASPPGRKCRANTATCSSA